MSASYALGRLARRLRHDRWVGLEVRRLEERLRTCALQLNRRERARLPEELASCRTPAALLAFARRCLVPGQKDREILALAAFAREDAPRVFCEIGTAHGGTHFFLAHALPSVETTIAIDLLVQRKATLQLLRKPGQEAHFRDDRSTSAGTLDWLVRTLAGRAIDLLFIDGDHSAEGVRADFLAYRGFVREGGLIAFHDICEDYTTRYGQRTAHYAGGVPAFWKTIRPYYEHREFIDAADQDGFGIGALVYTNRRPLPRHV